MVDKSLSTANTNICFGSRLASVKLSSLRNRTTFFFQSLRPHLSNFSFLVLVNTSLSALAFATRVKLANTMGIELFGLFAFALALANVATVVVAFGMDRTLVRDLIQKKEQQAQLVSSSVIIRFTLFTFVILLLLLSKSVLPSKHISLGVIVLAIGQTLIAFELRSLYDSWQEFKRHALYSALQRIIYFVFVWSFILFNPTQLSLLNLGYFSIFSMGIYLALQYRWASKRLSFHFKLPTLLHDSFTLAKHNLLVWFSALGCLSFGVINQIILKLYVSDEALGGYAAAWQIVSISILFLAQVSRIGNPRTAKVAECRTPKKTQFRFLVKYSLVMASVVLPISLSSILFPEFILKQMFNPEYITASQELRIMGIYILIYALGLVASQFVISSRLEISYFKSVYIGGILGIILCMVLIPKYHGVGAAISLLLSHGLSISIYWVSALRHINKNTTN